MSTLESDTLDFKEEHGSIDSHGARRPIEQQSDVAARVLAQEVACFANSPSGGVLVVGVDDKGTGPGAIVGSYLDTSWLRRRIFELTQPRFAVDVIEEREVVGKRVYLINVPPALEEVRVEGKLRARMGSSCEEVSGDRARQFLQARRGYDWSATPSGMRLSQADPEALAIARALYRDARGRLPAADRALASQLGLLAADGAADDPWLNNAGALLLGHLAPDQPQIDVLVTSVEGRPSRRRAEQPAPLLVAFRRVWNAIDESFPARPVIVGAQRREVRPVPERALREALVNATMHRDYDLPRSRIIVHVLGDPSTTLKVRSPGAFPSGVQADRLLTVPSRPRNPALAHAMHVLGLAEREGIGIDTMYLELLRDGHPEPTIVEDAGDVLCILSGGRADLAVRAFFDALEARDAALRDDVRAVIAITQLLHTTPLRPEGLAEVAQCTREEAFHVLDGLRSAGAIEPLVPRSHSFRLTRWALDQLRTRVAYRTARPLDDNWQVIRAHLDVAAIIGRDDVVALLGVGPVQASRILSQLYNERGYIEPLGKSRGRGVRYVLAEPEAHRLPSRSSG